MKKALLIDENDNVATAIDDLEPEEEISIKTESGEIKKKIESKEKIPFGHKIALKTIERDEKIKKYGKNIGEAIEKINAGEHVHIHNVEELRGN